MTYEPQPQNSTVKVMGDLRKKLLPILPHTVSNCIKPMLLILKVLSSEMDPAESRHIR
jgi:hypothetical protein